MSKTDYPLDKIRGIAMDVDGVLSPSTIPMSSDGQPMRMVNIKDGYALQLAVKRGIELAIISGGTSSATEKRYRSLGIEDVYMGTSHKLPVLKKWMLTHGLQPDEVAYVGDDIPDLECMRNVGLSVAPADAATDILNQAYYVTCADGGYGVARELIEQVLRAQGLWVLDHAAFGW